MTDPLTLEQRAQAIAEQLDYLTANHGSEGWQQVPDIVFSALRSVEASTAQWVRRETLVEAAKALKRAGPYLCDNSDEHAGICETDCAAEWLRERAEKTEG